MAYTEKQLVEALHFVWEKLKTHIPEGEQTEVTEMFPCVDELEQFGPTGPIGSGLGRFGGHAIGD